MVTAAVPDTDEFFAVIVLFQVTNFVDQHVVYTVPRRFDERWVYAN